MPFDLSRPFDWGECVKPIAGSDQSVMTLQCIPTLLSQIIGFAVLFAGIVAVILIVISGIKFITSGGDPKQVEGAKQTMTYAIIGLILILLSFTIVKAIGVITGADCITTFGFDNCK